MDDHDRQYLERILDERDRMYDFRYHSQQEAIRMARQEMERRLEGLNELRREVTEDRGRFLSVEKYEAERRGIEDALDEAREFRGKVLGLIATTAILAGVVGAAVAAVVAHLLT